MPRILDNINLLLLSALQESMDTAVAADFCVGYFNLRGWEHLADMADKFEGTDGSCCRILVGMHKPPEAETREAYRAVKQDRPLDPPALKRLQRAAAESFRAQLTFGVPTNAAEATLKRLAQQLRAGKVRVKLYLRASLHAKLYLVHRGDHQVPLIGYVGSSNLTHAGLSGNGELNVDVLEQDAAEKLHQWFHDRWDDRYSQDISETLAELIEESWVDRQIRPYLAYLKIIHHLSKDAHHDKGIILPSPLNEKLLDYQVAAVELAYQHLSRRNGVLLGDVVGLGKTYMAIAVARILQEDEGGDALIICPPKLAPMWEHEAHENGLLARIIPISRVQDTLPEMRKYKLLIIDESHNLRNRDGQRYQAIQDYIEREEPKCMLLTATPYNKTYLDLSNQLRLFVEEKHDLGVRPTRYFEENDEGEFKALHQASPCSLIAFEKSEFPDDWRDLMRLFMVRRTRRFIIDNYSEYDAECRRSFVKFPDGRRSYFPSRLPRNLEFELDESNPDDQYAGLYRPEIVDIINDLNLPRYGLAEYLDEKRCTRATAGDQKIMDDLGRARRRLIAYCRTNLFKRLESSGQAFILSVRRHILRNMVTLYALENELPIPIGTQDAALLDTATSDSDQVTDQEVLNIGDNEPEEVAEAPCNGLEWFENRAEEVYANYSTSLKKRFRWLEADYFQPQLATDLREDAAALCGVLHNTGDWQPEHDSKLTALETLLTKQHRRDKVIVFTQFADTASYLAAQLRERGMHDMEVVTGAHADPTAVSNRFSPVSNNYTLRSNETEIRVIITTDVLSEGQNLQDGHIVVNYDLPWAIIRLIQRAGRVDRIGQRSKEIMVYSFLPAEGVERIINLQGRLRQRFTENNEVVGSDEQFFSDEYEHTVRDLYTERESALDDPEDTDVDLASMALQIWNGASEADQKAALALPPMVYATRAHSPAADDPCGALVYLHTPEGNDSLVRVDTQGQVISQSLSAVLRDAVCPPDTQPCERQEQHHDWVLAAVQAAMTDQKLTAGALGPPRSIRRRIYERMNTLFETKRGTLFATGTLKRAIDAIYKYPLTSRARTTLSRQMRLKASDDTLSDIVTSLYDEERLVNVEEQPTETAEPDVICSIGLKDIQGDNTDAH